MRYKNKITGAIIDIPGEISGDVWEPIEVKAKPTKEPEPKAVETKPEKKATKTKSTGRSKKK